MRKLYEFEKAKITNRIQRRVEQVFIKNMIGGYTNAAKAELTNLFINELTAFITEYFYGRVMISEQEDERSVASKAQSETQKPETKS
jgi:50S ribosomal subunit-associated GTPase HflX